MNQCKKLLLSLRDDTTLFGEPTTVYLKHALKLTGTFEKPLLVNYTSRRMPEVLQSRLLELVEDRKAMDVLFPAAGELEHTKAWLYAAVRRVCDAAGVTRVCPHSLRGTHTSLALSIGQGSQAVADSLGHESARTTIRHYAGAGSAEAGTQERTLRVLDGGRK